MIAALSGKLIEKEANTVVIEAGGVGYEVTIPLSTFYSLGELGTVVSLRIHTYVREDALQLFGFSSGSDRALFLRLIAVSGIGPKLAVAMLSAMGSDEIVSAITTDNIAALTSIPGIGKKTAERMIIELRDKIAELAPVGAAAAAAAAAGGSSGSEAVDDALSALINLGYQRKAADKALKKAVQEGTEMSVQKLLKRGLQILARN